jgi:hypothetical protein
MAADREPARKLAPETVARMADEVVAVPLDDKDRKAVVEMLQSLAADMAALRAFGVGDNEPATVYDAEAEA